MKMASLRVRVTSWYGGLLAAALIIFGSTVWLGLRSYLNDTLQKTLRNESANIVDQFVADVDAKGINWLAGEIEESYAPESDGRYIRILRAGRVLYQSHNAASAAMQTWPAGVSAEDASGFFSRIAAPAGPLLLYTLAWDSPAGIHFLVQEATPTSAIDSILKSLLIALCLLTPVILVGAAVGGYLLMNVPFRPVVELTRQTERIGTQAPGERLPVIPTGDELERLSISLNRMIARLEDALAHNRRFSADVSHELRTPLTIMRGELEPLVENRALPPAALDAIGSVLEETERMSDIVESLLVISRLDAQDPLQRAPVNLSALALSTVEQMQLLAEDKDLKVHADVAEEVFVPGDRVRLQQVIVNLLDNAIKYTPAGGEIWLSVFSQGHRGVVEIRDSGIGIPAECLPFVFDRFYRADKARSRESGGTGLGLSIVKAICTAHGGEVAIHSRDHAGTTVRVELPICSPEEIAQLPEQARRASMPAGAPQAAENSHARSEAVLPMDRAR